MNLRRAAVLVLACLLCASAPARAELWLPAVFGPNMVLQADRPVPVWGTDDKGATITVTFAAQSATAVAGADGRWKVTLKPMKPSAKGRTLVITSSIANRQSTIPNVLVGEVWVCSGQSNMGWTVKQSANAEAEIAAAKYPDIRLFTVPRRASSTPQKDCAGSWSSCAPDVAGNFSAVGYFFGRQLHKDLKVPVGLINTSWGGTRVEAWTSMPAMRSEKQAADLLEWWDERTRAYDPATAAQRHTKALETYRARLAAEKKRIAEAKKAGKKVRPRRIRGPRKPTNPAEDRHHPSTLYNGMIAPIVPFACRGAIWYQGESNASRGYQYRALFPLMIRDWRKAWGYDLAFLWVQLANFRDRKPEPADDAWAELREAQSMTLALPNTAEAVIIDIGETNNIHPKNKQDVGRRLALGARKIAYGQDIVHSGPRFKAMKIVGGKAVLSFDHVGGGLAARGGKLVGFAIAGADRKFVWADAAIAGKTVVVSSDKVKQPAAVRYAWATNPACNLYNAEGLPASPFRTDDWPGVTKDKRTP